jgi:hypothetical protein
LDKPSLYALVVTTALRVVELVVNVWKERRNKPRRPRPLRRVELLIQLRVTERPQVTEPERRDGEEAA